MTSDRFRPLTTIHNLRDYGGYATADGGQVKTGLLWRSGHHADASDADLGEVAAIDFADVIDLRGNSERATNTCRRANNFAGEVHFHDGETAGLGLALHEQAGEQAVSEESAFLAMRKLYADLPFRDGLNAILPHYFAILAKGRGPSLVHCAAGKDRTGIAVDLLHHILGVHPDDAMEDYLLTNHAPNNEARIARGMEMIGKKYGNRIEALQQGPTAPLDPALVSNPGEVLAPRKSLQYEVGGKLALGDVFVGLGAYRLKRPGEGVLADGSFGYLGDQTHQGIEFTVNGDLTPSLRLIGGAALTDAKLVSGNEVPGVSEYTANADLEWDLGFVPGATITARAVHTGPQWVDAANTLELDSWTRIDLGARYVFAADDTPVTLRLSADNITNEKYWASAFDVFSAALLQGTPRTIKASISADF